MLDGAIPFMKSPITPYCHYQGQVHEPWRRVTLEPAAVD